MTLNYKILGQLYYGPEINETPEVPSTAGYYTSTTTTYVDKYVALNLTEWNAGAVSDDGINWTAVTTPAQGGYVTIAYGNGKFIASKSNGSLLLHSPDGTTWTEIVPTSTDNMYTYPSVSSEATLAYGNGVFVLVGGDSQAWVSADGFAWTPYSTGGSQWKSVKYVNNQFVAVSYSYVSYSTDGTSWTTQSLPGGSNWSDITYGNGTYVVTAVSYGGVAISSDLLSWSVPGTSLDSWQNVVFGSGVFVAASSTNGTFLHSPDFTLWSASTNVSGLNGLEYLIYGNGKFIATNQYSYTSAYSTNGSTWTLTTLPGSSPMPGSWSIAYGQVVTQTEVQVSIGNQGTPGSYVEIIEPQILYTVPASTQTTVTSIYVTNHDSVQRTYDLAVVPAGETLGLKHHIRWDMPVATTDFDLLTAKLTLGAGDRLYVFPSTINKVGFTAFGVEKS